MAQLLSVFLNLIRAFITAIVLVVAFLGFTRFLSPETAVQAIYAAIPVLIFVFASSVAVCSRLAKRRDEWRSQIARIVVFLSAVTVFTAVIFTTLWRAGFPAWIWWRLSNTPVLVTLERIPGISDEALAARNKLYRVAEPIPYIPRSRIASFEVEILSSGFEDTNIVFAGDGLGSTSSYQRSGSFMRTTERCSEM